MSITNIGVFGVDTGTPILPPGQSAIIALGTVSLRPWVVDGELQLIDDCRVPYPGDAEACCCTVSVHPSDATRHGLQEIIDAAVAGRAEQGDQPGTDVPVMTGDEDAHLGYSQTFHGALPESQSDWSSLRSRMVSMHCQKPLCL